MTDTRYTITELAREFEVTPRAIRFYENQGLLTPAQLHAFLDTIAAHRAVLTRQLDDLNATLAELSAYEAQGRALLSANAEKRTGKAAVSTVPTETRAKVP